ncbi:MAG: Gfo/Idh/MocA family protein [Promethearchaeota archaeon]
MTKYAIVGLGYWGKNHLRSLIKLRSQKIVDEIIVCDISDDALERTKEYPEIEVCKVWTHLLNDESLDMVSIVSPSPFHFEMTKAFLLAGKDVLVEKPMALTSKECEELLEIQKQTKKGLMVGHIFRFHPAILELRNRIQKGEFGEILYMIVRRMALRIPRKDMGVMLALGIHEVDLTCFLLGDKTPDSIFADMNYLYDDQEEMAFILQKFGKCSAYSFESWVDPTQGKLRELSLVGSLGSVTIDFLVPNEIKIIKSYLDVEEGEKGKEFTIINKGESIINLDPQEPLLEEIKHFIIESQGNKNYKADGNVGRRAVVMIEKAIEAHTNKKVIKM